VLGFLKTTPSKPVPFLIAIFNLVLLASCMVCHGELVRLKPHPAYLTRFYLMISAGGAAGGVFVALIAPLIFSGYWEYQVGLTGCVLLVIVVLMRDGNSWWYGTGAGSSSLRQVRGLPQAAAVPRQLLLLSVARSFHGGGWRRFSARAQVARNL
jgi:hypothetical protein